MGEAEIEKEGKKRSKEDFHKSKRIKRRRKGNIHKRRVIKRRHPDSGSESGTRGSAKN